MAAATNLAEANVRIVVLEAMLEKLIARVAKLIARVEELEQRLGRNSGNSSQPP